MSGGGWRAEGTGNVQVGSALRRKRRWGAGARDRGNGKKMLLLGGGRQDRGGEDKRSKQLVEIGGAGGIVLNVKLYI